MKSHILLVCILFCWLILTGISEAFADQNANRQITVIPLPVKMQIHSGEFRITAKTKIMCNRSRQDIRSTADYFAQRVRKATGFLLPVADSKKTSRSGNVLFQIVRNKQLGSEGYELTVDSNAVEVRANTSAGLLDGVQTLFQLLPPELL